MNNQSITPYNYDRAVKSNLFDTHVWCQWALAPMGVYDRGVIRYRVSSTSQSCWSRYAAFQSSLPAINFPLRKVAKGAPEHRESLQNLGKPCSYSHTQCVAKATKHSKRTVFDALALCLAEPTCSSTLQSILDVLASQLAHSISAASCPGQWK
jgi:hypothetical protein